MNRYFRHKIHKEAIFELVTLEAPFSEDQNTKIIVYIRMPFAAVGWKPPIFLTSDEDLEELHGPEKEILEILYSG